MPAAITTLIDKVDSAELIRDQIAAIIVVESAEQQVLAADADPAQDPRLYELRVFTERSNPWEEFISETEDDGTPRQVDATPIVNVSFESSTFDKGGSTAHERQRATGTFNVDCYGYGVSVATEDGHTSGDEAAGIEALRAARLVRNILMAAAYTYLGLSRGQSQVVAGRWISSITAFTPTIEGRAFPHVVGVRLALEVTFNEFSPQVEGEALEGISAEVERAENGEIYLTATYEYGEP